MKMKERLELKNSFDRKIIVERLREGKIGLFPTDTVWGICCSIDSKSSIERIYKIKKREKNKPLLALASDYLQVERYAFLDNSKKEKISKYWPGPLTVVLKAKKEKVLPIVRSDGDTIAIRVPDYHFLLEIIGDLGVPVVAPSANFSGEITPESFSDVDIRIVNAVDFVVMGECKIKKPSTIIDSSSEDVRVLRRGALEFKI